MIWDWWVRTVPGRDRLVLLAAVVVRLAAVALLVYSVPMVWRHLPYPGWTLLLAAGAGVESLAVVAWWLRQRRPDPRTLLADLPAGLAVLVVGGALAPRHGVVGWTWFGYPYTIVLSFAVGLVCRSWRCALGSGAAWAAGCLATGTLVRHGPFGPSLGAVPPYLVVGAVGWLSARLLRRTTDELERAGATAVREAAALATSRERDRHARALHDRVLQTLETLARGDAVADPAIRATVAEQAGWLRSYVETGRADGDDLAAGLAAVVRLAAREGVAVELNDARLRFAGTAPELPPRRRDLLIEATHHAVVALGRQGAEVVVRAGPDNGGVLVTVLAAHPAGTVGDCARELADTQEHVRRAGGRASVEPLPYVELWLPTGDVAPTALRATTREPDGR
jgi:hypothetical protein